MPLVLPRFIVLDSATLGKLSHDYWSQKDDLRNKAHTLVAQLQEQNVYVTLTLTHILEMLQHGDQAIVNDRLGFLRSLPLVARLRPYDRNWFPGDITDLLRRELDAAVHSAKVDWRAIVEEVRNDVWETGVGTDLFTGNDELWSPLRTFAQQQMRQSQYVASVVRTDAGEINDVTLAEVKQFLKRPKSERHSFMQSFLAELQRQLDQHGDSRIEDTFEAASGFVDSVKMQLDYFDIAGRNSIQMMLEYAGVPSDFVNDQMTVGDVCQLAVYVKQLEILSRDLHPHAAITIRDTPPDRLPSYVTQRRLAAIQRKAARVSGSDLGDTRIAPLVLYADGVEVDKRTFEYLSQVKRAQPSLACLVGHFFPSGNYGRIPERCASSHESLKR